MANNGNALAEFIAKYKASPEVIDENGRNGVDGNDGVLNPGIPLLQRTVIRAQGCFNCKHYENGIRYQMQWEKRMFDTAKHVTLRGLEANRPFHEAALMGVKEVQRAQRLFGNKAGICEANKQPDGAEFVLQTYKCDHWTGMSGTLGSAQKQEPLVGELKETLDSTGVLPGAVAKLKEE